MDRGVVDEPLAEQAIPASRLWPLRPNGTRCRRRSRSRTRSPPSNPQGPLQAGEGCRGSSNHRRSTPGVLEPRSARPRLPFTISRRIAPRMASVLRGCHPSPDRRLRRGHRQRPDRKDLHRPGRLRSPPSAPTRQTTATGAQQRTGSRRFGRWALAGCRVRRVVLVVTRRPWPDWCPTVGGSRRAVGISSSQTRFNSSGSSPRAGW